MGEPALSAVGTLARDGDEARFLAALFAPVAKREPLFALIAFNAELAKIPVSVSEPILGEIRLTWWREALDDMFDRDIARGHEVLEALIAAHRTRPFDRAALTSLIDARLFALSDEPAAEGAVDAFLRDTGGAYHRLAVAALGGDDAAQEVAALAGIAEGAGRLIMATQVALAGGGAAPFMAGPDTEALQEPDAQADMRTSLRALATKGLVSLTKARARRNAVPRAARAPLLSVHTAEPVLRHAASQDFDLTSLGEPSPFRARASLLGRALLGRF
ncbi:MAG: squalene/phytoene synthase family protein [Pseudomonadota bacterium]